MKRQDATAECLMLEEHVFSVTKRFLAMYKKANAGHIGSSLSCAEIWSSSKFGWMRDDDTIRLVQRARGGCAVFLARRSQSAHARADRIVLRRRDRAAGAPPLQRHQRDPLCHGEPGARAVGERGDGARRFAEPKGSSIFFASLPTANSTRGASGKRPSSSLITS